MLTIDGIDFSFSNMGLFDSETEWIHPTISVQTYEIIFVVEGEVNLFEDTENYSLTKGDMIILSPNTVHGGSKKSYGHTSFYWLHFTCSNIEKIFSQKLSRPLESETTRTFSEIMHYQSSSHDIAELTLAKFLLEQNRPHEQGNRIAHEIAEFIRANSQKALTVGDVGRRFGYNPDHVSRILKREFGQDTKTMITKKRLEYIESLLINSQFSIKDIASSCSFSDENTFVKFFKYHTGITPTAFRNKYYHLHINTR